MFFGVVMFVVYGLMMWLVVWDDMVIVSFFWILVVGVIIMIIIGINSWEFIVRRDILWLLVLCLCVVIVYFLLIKVYELVEVFVL